MNLCNLILVTLCLAPGQMLPKAPRPSSPAGTSQLNPASSPQLVEYAKLITGENTPEARKLGATKLLEAGTDESRRLLSDILRTIKAQSTGSVSNTTRTETNDPPAARAILPAQLAVCAAICDFEKPPAQLVAPLVSLLGDPGTGINDAVAKALRRFEASVVLKELSPLLSDGSIEMRRRVASIAVLAVLGDDLAAVAAIAKLLDDPSQTIRSAALSAFNQATGVRHENVAAALVWWKSRRTLLPGQWLKEVNEARRTQLALLHTENDELTARLVASVRESFLGVPEQQRPKKLLDTLSDDVAAVRSLALDLINDLITDRKDVSQEIKARVAEMIADSDPAVRLKVAQVIGDLRLAAALSKLTEVLSRENDPAVRCAQIAALTRLDDVAAVPALIERLDDESPQVAADAALALGAIVRKGKPNSAAAQRVSQALLVHFEKLPASSEQIRAKYLVAMTRIGADAFRPLFKREMAADRNVGVRRAAIEGLANYADAAVSDSMRELLAAAEPEVRLAAVKTLGQCGTKRDDLEAIEPLLDDKRETDAVVRQLAWESYLMIASRLSPEDQLAVSDSFDRRQDTASQRCRLDLLKKLKNGNSQRPLPRSERFQLLKRMADAQMKLTEFAAAAASFEQSANLVEDRRSDEAQALYAKSVNALLRAHEDAAAVQRGKELIDGDPLNGEIADAKTITNAIRDEINQRLQAAVDAAGFAGAENLATLAAGLSSRGSATFGNDIGVLKTQIETARAAFVDNLLANAPEDSEAESKLLDFGKEIVVPRLLAMLGNRPATSAPAVAQEERLLRLGRKLVPDWGAYETGDSADLRQKALRELRESSQTSKPTARISASPDDKGL